MIRQARTYLVSAMSGATLIAIAIAAFVVLVSAQVFSDWPMSALRGSGAEAEVSTSRPVAPAVLGAPGVAAVTTRAAGGGAEAAGKGDVPAGAGAGLNDVDTAAVGSTPASEPSGSEPSGSGFTPATTGTGGDTGSPAAGSGTESSGSSGGSSSNGGGGSGGGGSTASSPSRTVTETVNGAVSGVDESALGGTLNNSGVTGVTEGVVNGVAGPESTVGQAVDGAAGTVGGLLTPKR